MTTIDLYFAATAHTDWLDDMRSLGLVSAITDDAGSAVILPTDSNIVLDWIGALEQTPAQYDMTDPEHPIETAPANYYPGDRANLRLTGPLAEQRAAMIAGAAMPHTQLLAPADVPAAQMRWAGGSTPWDGQAVVPPPPPSPTLDLDAQKSRLLARLAQRRWEVETGRITVSGAQVRTDRESQSMLAGALLYFDLNPAATTVRWKTASGGFIDLDAPTLRSIALSVGKHVQACFAREAEFSAGIAGAQTAEALTPIAAGIEGFAP